MRLTTRLRATGAWAVLPAVALLLALYLSTDVHGTGEYGLADQVDVLSGAPLFLPVIGLAAAVAGHRFAPALARRPPGRGTAAVLLAHLGPPVAAGLAVVVAAVTVTAARAAVPRAPDLRLLSLLVLATTAYAVIGFALGLSLRLLVAGPLALALPYLLIGFPPAFEPLWLRHLTWVDSCCSVSQDLHPRALIALAATSTALLALGLAVVVRRLRRAVLAPLLLVALAPLLLTGAVAAARPLGVGAAVDRAGSPRCAPAGGVPVCLWPEHEHLRARIAAPVTRLVAVTHATSAPAPHRLTEADQARWPDVAAWFSPVADDGALTDSLAQAMAQQLPPRCRPGTTTEGQATHRQMTVEEVRTAWWLNHLGRSATMEKSGGVGSEAAASYRRLSAQPMPRQVAWLARTGAQLRACQDVRLP